MNASNLEKDLIVEFFKIEQIDTKILTKALDEIEILDRDFTGPGFVTKFRRNESLKVANNNQNFQWEKMSAYINEERIHVAFIFYIKKGYIEAIEGFTFGETWPEKILCYEFSYFRTGGT